MSMLKKSIVLALLFGSTTPVLASDASDDAAAARRARESSARNDRRMEMSPSGVMEGPDGARVDTGRHASAGSGDCSCRCASQHDGGHRSPRDPSPDYGG